MNIEMNDLLSMQYDVVNLLDGKSHILTKRVLDFLQGTKETTNVFNVKFLLNGTYTEEVVIKGGLILKTIAEFYDGRRKILSMDSRCAPADHILTNPHNDTMIVVAWVLTPANKKEEESNMVEIPKYEEVSQKVTNTNNELAQALKKAIVQHMSDNAPDGNCVYDIHFNSGLKLDLDTDQIHMIKEHLTSLIDSLKDDFAKAGWAISNTNIFFEGWYIRLKGLNPIENDKSGQ